MTDKSNNSINRWVLIPVAIVLIVLGMRQFGLGLEQLGFTDAEDDEEYWDKDVYEMPIAPRQAHTIVDEAGFEPGITLGSINLPTDWQRKTNTEWKGDAECGYTSQTHLVATSQDNRAKIEVGDSIARFIWKEGSTKPSMSDDPCLGKTHLQNQVINSVEDFVNAYFLPQHRPGYQLDDIVAEPDAVTTTPGGAGSDNTKIKIAKVYLSKVTPQRVILESVFVNLRVSSVTVDDDEKYKLGQAVVIALAANEDYFYRIEPLLDEVIGSYQIDPQYQAAASAPGFTPHTLTTETQEATNG